eukprot:COSAG04_NODE_175_length_21521_cov_167.404071_4_plen_38_part_00
MAVLLPCRAKLEPMHLLNRNPEEAIRLARSGNTTPDR